MYVSVSPYQDPWVGLNWGQDKLTSLNDLKFRDLHRKLVDLRSEFQKLNQKSGGQLVFVSTTFYTEVFYLLFCTWELKYPLHWAVIECIYIPVADLSLLSFKRSYVMAYIYLQYMHIWYMTEALIVYLKRDKKDLGKPDIFKVNSI